MFSGALSSIDADLFLIYPDAPLIRAVVITLVFPFVGSLILMLGTIGEARAVTRRTWVGTIWRLLTCRLTDVHLPLGACPACGYQLLGLREARCPECGRPFTFTELGVTAEQIGFAGADPPPKT